jgi:uncharacterized protein YkwD
MFSEGKMTTTRRSGVVALLAGITVAAGLCLAPAQATTSGQYQRGIFSATNHQRAVHDRSAFRHQACVQRFAERQARRMADQERMFHQDLGRVLSRCHLHKAGENVAYGFDLGVAVVNLGWMHSPDHRANILDPDFRLLGAGARRGDNGVWYAAQVFGRR